MRRRLLNLATAASLVVFIATAVFWVRSCWANDYVEFISIFRGSPRVGFAYVGSERGHIYVHARRFSPPHGLDESLHGERFNVGSDPHAAVFSLGNFEAVCGRQANGDDVFYLGVPHLFILLLAATPPVYWVRSHGRRRSGARAGGRPCPACGYDVRATPDLCPECGAVPAATSGVPKVAVARAASSTSNARS